MVNSQKSFWMHRLFSKRLVFPFLAFVVPFLLRAVPEFIMGPYLVGFDTMGHYVPTTLLWLRGDVTFLSFVGTAPLFYSIITSLVSFGGSLIMVLKVVSVASVSYTHLTLPTNREV